MPDWIPLVVATVSVMGFLFALFKWQQHVTDQKDEARQTANDQRHRDFEKIIDEHKNQFSKLERHIERNEQELLRTRDEIHKDYVHRDQQQQFSTEVYGIVEKIFNKVDHMAKDLNQLIGQINNGN